MSDCIFCKIANGEIGSFTVYEDNDFRGIMDISPASRGHVIILPKKHAADIYELDDDIASKIYVVAKKIATAVKEVTGCDGVNVLENNGEAAGQTVLHFHVHLIPRYRQDAELFKYQPGKPDEKELEEIKKLITE